MLFPGILIFTNEVFNVAKYATPIAKIIVKITTNTFYLLLKI